MTCYLLNNCPCSQTYVQYIQTSSWELSESSEQAKQNLHLPEVTSFTSFPIKPSLTSVFDLCHIKYAVASTEILQRIFRISPQAAV